MRSLIVIALAGCYGPSTDSECPEIAVSEIEHAPGVILSGPNSIGITWTRRVQGAAPEIHAAIVTPDGTIGPDIAAPEDAPSGAVGNATVLWASRDRCGTQRPFVATLQRGGDAKFVDPTTDSFSRGVTFDGTRYQLFWTALPNLVYHASIDEDGTLGAARTLAITGQCIDVASDRAGTTFLRVDHKGYIVNTTTGELRVVFQNLSPTGSYGESFYFAGEFHVVSVSDKRLLSFPATSTGAFTPRPLGHGLEGATEFHPMETTMFANGPRGPVEVDAALATVRQLPYSSILAIGALGSDLVRFTHDPLDSVMLTPGRVELVRENAWTKEIAVDSEVRLEDACEDIAF